MTGMKEVKMGQLRPTWMAGEAKTITFCVTEDCNLACKYCYMTGKNSKVKMNFETAKKAVDYVLSSTDREFDHEGVIWEFIGGEPFLEIELIDKITDYIKIQMFVLNHRWFDAYRFSFSSNGTLYHTRKVQDYILKNRAHLSIGISIDGNKVKHDLSRVYKDGTGTYDDVIKNIPLWLKQFPGGQTKATFSHDDLPFLKDSIISLWNVGLKIVPANVVFEDVWHEGDDLLFENQLKELADYIIENELWWDHSVRFFDPLTGFPLDREDLKRNFCGSGKMLAIDCMGKFSACVRFYDISLNNKKGRRTFGDVENGIDYDKVRPFSLLSFEAQCTDECINCCVATGCAWCTGNNFDCSDTDTIYQRSIFNCKMHKANVRANEYFWNKLSEVLGYMPEERQMKIDKALRDYGKYLQLITSDKIIPHCSYRNWRNTSEEMNIATIEKSLEFAHKNGYTPVFLGEYKNPNNVKKERGSIVIKNGNTDQAFYRNEFPVFDNNVDKIPETISECILLINKENISNIVEHSIKLFNKVSKINLRLENIETWTEETLKLYENQLDKLTGLVLESYKKEAPVEINVLTDIMSLDTLEDCGAGVSSFSVAPNGKIYYCPAFYFDNPENYIGSLDEGITIKNSYLLDVKKAPICLDCDAFHCSRCKFLNKKCTYEINTPSKMQCVISHTERNKARLLQISLMQLPFLKEVNMQFINTIKKIDYLDPLEKRLTEKKRFEGCI